MDITICDSSNGNLAFNIAKSQENQHETKSIGSFKSNKAKTSVTHNEVYAYIS